MQGEEHLALLSLRRNHLTAAPALPPEICETLAVLDASHNAITCLRGISDLKVLKALMLSHNHLTDLRSLQVSCGMIN